jgi:hypothetical protein
MFGGRFESKSIQSVHYIFISYRFFSPCQVFGGQFVPNREIYIHTVHQIYILTGFGGQFELTFPYIMLLDSYKPYL